MVRSSFCADCRVMVRVLSDCWASSTFALGFLVRPFGSAAGCAGEGGVVSTRLGVEAIGAPRLSAAGHKAALQRGERIRTSDSRQPWTSLLR